MAAADNSPSNEASLEKLLAEYLHAAESDQPIDQQQVIAAHPEFADELRSFFANREALERIAEPLKGSAYEPTMGLAASSQTGELKRVRYFGDYELLEEIARGGMGVVYRARQVNLKRIVALKMILAGQLAGHQEVERFHAEAEAAAKLDHPNIVPIFEVGEYEGQHYFSMAFVEGESLAQRVGRGVLPPREAAELLRQIALAIGYAHVEGVVHRDLKPANVLLDRDGQPRVTDFGLAKHVEGDHSGMTATGQILGTPSYMPPEQAGGDRDNIGPLSDIYSLGAILYCLLTGRPPFQAATPVETLMQVMTREPVGPRQLNSDVPRDLETICLKCLEKEPEQRYSSAQELADELQRFLEGRPIHARPISGPARAIRWCRRNPVVAGLTAAVAALLVVGSVVSSSLAVEARSRAVEAEHSAQRARLEAERADENYRKAQAETERANKSFEQAETQRKSAETNAERAEAAKQQSDQSLYVAHMNLAQSRFYSRLSRTQRSSPPGR